MQTEYTGPIENHRPNVWSNNYQQSNECIGNYFKKIYNAEETTNFPTVDDLNDELMNFENYIPVLDDMPTDAELDLALLNAGKGIGLAGLPPDVLPLLPLSLKNIIKDMMKKFS